MPSYNEILEQMDSTSATERTSLLTAPVNTGVRGNSGVPIEQTTTTDYESINIFQGDESFPILSKAISNASFGIVETIPTSIQPDGHGHLRLKNDGLKQRQSGSGVEDANETGFHGGISKKRFWIIFTGWSLVGARPYAYMLISSIQVS